MRLIFQWLFTFCTIIAQAQSNSVNALTITLEVKSGDSTHAFVSTKPVELTAIIHNTNVQVLKKTEISICVQTFGGKEYKNLAFKIDSITGNSDFSYTFSFDVKENGFYISEFSLKDSTQNLILSKTRGFAVDPGKVISPYPKPKNFKYFWVKTLANLAKIPPSYTLTERKDLGNDSMAVYSVEFRSLDSARIQGWYVYPKNKKKLRAVILTQGYSAANNFSVGYLQYTEYAQFLLNVRGHGGSSKDVNPGFPTFLEYGLASPYTYIFRGAYMDCVRSIDFLCSRPEIDSSRIGIWGTSMGGALAYATAGLDRRIKLCVADLPFLSDFRNYFEIGNWPSTQIKSYAARNNRSMTSIYQTLDYFDIKNLTPWIQCPVMMGVGLLDMTCPPAINFAAYNNLRIKDKHFFLLPETGHDITTEYALRVRAAFLNKL